MAPDTPKPLENPGSETEVARLRRLVEAQAAALSNLALTAQLLAEQVEELRRGTVDGDSAKCSSH